MRPLPLLTEQTDRAWTKNIKVVATDIDGTLTDENGCLTNATIDAFHQLTRAGIKILLVTGRPATWGQSLVQYLPVDGGITENGGVFILREAESRMQLIANNQLETIEQEAMRRHRAQLSAAFETIRAQGFDQLVPTGDCLARMTDYTFPLDGLSQSDINRIQQICTGLKYGFTFSSIHGHIKPAQQNKALGIETIISHIPLFKATPEEVITIGDSVNDQDMFDSNRFPHSIGVANISKHLANMTHQPRLYTQAPGSEGFCEMVNWLIEAKR